MKTVVTNRAAPAESEATVRGRFSFVKPGRFLTGAALKKASQTRSKKLRPYGLTAWDRDE